MRNADDDMLDSAFEWRLKAALDRITPRVSFPRYSEPAKVGFRKWRLAPIVVAAGAACLLALTAAAFTTGSPNPVVWTQRAASTIVSAAHAPDPSPSPAPSQPARAAPYSAPVAPAPRPTNAASPRPEPSGHPEQSPRPEPSESPYPGGDHSEPSPGHSPGPSPLPSPPPGPSPGHGDH